MEQSALRGRHVCAIPAFDVVPEMIYPGINFNEGGAIGPSNLPWPKELLEVRRMQHVIYDEDTIKAREHIGIDYLIEGTPDFGG